MLRIEQLGPATFFSFDPQATAALEKPTVATLLLTRLSCRELVAVTYLIFANFGQGQSRRADSNRLLLLITSDHSSVAGGCLGWQNLHTYKGFLSSVCSVLHRIAFPVVSGWCQFQVRRLHVAGPFSSTGAEGLGRRPFARQTDYQVSVTLLKPRGESGSSPLRRARFSASNWMGVAQSIGDNSSGSEPGNGNLADA